MKSNCDADSIVIWQERTDDDMLLPGEPALLIESYYDVISIQQGDQSININYETVKELCKVLKSMKPYPQ